MHVRADFIIIYTPTLYNLLCDAMIYWTNEVKRTQAVILIFNGFTYIFKKCKE